MSLEVGHARFQNPAKVMPAWRCWLYSRVPGWINRTPGVDQIAAVVARKSVKAQRGTPHPSTRKIWGSRWPAASV